MDKKLHEIVAKAILDAGYNFNAGSLEGPMEAQRAAERLATKALENYETPDAPEKPTKEELLRAAKIELAIVDRLEDEAYALWTKLDLSEEEQFESTECVRRALECRKRGETLLRLVKES